MSRIARAPPVVGLALAAGAGATLVHLGVHPAWTLLSLTLLFRPRPTSSRPALHPLPLVLAFLAGALLARDWALTITRDCRYRLEEDAPLEVRGRLLGRLAEGRGTVRPLAPVAGGCDRPLRFVLAGRAAADPAPGGDDPFRAEGHSTGSSIPPGALVGLEGRWRRSGVHRGGDPLRAGYLRVEAISAEGGSGGRWPGPAGLLGWVQGRLGELFLREGPLAEALVLARKESLSPGIREAFARAGTAHLLAISGFHVGVVGGLVLLAGACLGLSHPLRFLLGSAGVWAYVFLIGLPDAAVRAALILTLLTAGRLRGRAVVSLGALASAFLVFLVSDPGSLLRPGFQLSFAGALGLVLWVRPLSRKLSGPGPPRMPPTVASGVAAGVAATLATLPLVAWHFGRVSAVGIPATLLAAPLVTLAIPGIFLSLFLSFLHPAAGAFFARGVEVDLWLFRTLVEGAGVLPVASFWVSRPGVAAGMSGLLLAHLFLALRPRPGRGRRGIVLMVWTLSCFTLWPVADRVAGRGTMEIVVLDVGQGDAILLRSPRRRWLLVDAGPRTRSYDAGDRAVLPYLRRRGVGRLEFVVLSHPDMDHVGGAEAVLRGYPVARVMDPGLAVGTEVFLGALKGARDRGIPWIVGASGDSLDVDGVALRVLWPPAGGGEGLLGTDGANETSLVLEVRYGSFAALLTGDASVAVEEAFLPGLLSPVVQVLKVGHHGSLTSTSSELLERTTPRSAVISVGRRNRYGHPHPGVLRRLEAAGVEVLRTDRRGTLTLRARRDGTFEVRGERGQL